MTKGYFLGAEAPRKKCEEGMRLCFRKSSGPFFGDFYGWKPVEYVVTSSGMAAANTNILQKDCMFRNAELTGMKYNKYRRIKGKKLSVIKVPLDSPREKNRAWGQINEKKMKDVFAIYPDNGGGIPYELSFYQGMKMSYQGEYDLDLEETGKSNPDGSPVYEISHMEPTGKSNRDIGVISWDIESSVDNWDIVLLASTARFPGGAIKKTSYVRVPPGREPDKFRREFIDPDEGLFDEHGPVEIKLCRSDMEILQGFAGQLSRDLQSCDIVTTFNGKSYDEGEAYSKDPDKLVQYTGKCGHRITLRPNANTGFSFNGPGLWDMDNFYFVNKGRFNPLRTTRNRLSDVERRLKLKPRGKELPGMGTRRLYREPHLYTMEMRHNITDTERNLFLCQTLLDMHLDEISQTHVPPDYFERRPPVEIEGIKYNAWLLENGIVPGMYNPFSAEKFKSKAFVKRNMRFVRNE